MRFVGLIWLWISLSCLLVYGCMALCLILFSTGFLLVASDWGAVVENTVTDSHIRFERYFFCEK